MQSFGFERRSPAFGDVVVYLVAVAGLAACLTVLFLAMRAVMDIGGACAEGGPYIPVRSCPAGVPLLMILVFPLGFLFGGLMAWRGSRLGGPHGGLVMLFWPALFLSLGWNFLEYAFKYPEEGVIWGWLICGVVFVLMGGVPLLGVLLPDGTPKRVSSATGDGDGPPRTGDPGQTGEPAWATGTDMAPAGSWQERRRLAELRRLQRGLKQVAAMRRPASPAASGGPDDLVSRLERLANLRRSGALSDVEFQAAKQRLLAAEPSSPTTGAGT